VAKWEYGELHCYRGKLKIKTATDYYYDEPGIFFYLPDGSHREYAPKETLPSPANRDGTITKTLSALGEEGWEVITVETSYRVYAGPASEWHHRRFWLKRELKE
jgi:hypothetical protein